MNAPQTQPLQLIEQQLDVEGMAMILARNRVGMNDDISNVLYEHSIDPAWFAEVSAAPDFNELVTKYADQLAKEGFPVESKAAYLHERGLVYVYNILRDPEQPAPARLKAHEQLGDIAGKGKVSQRALAAGAQSSVPAFNIIFNLAPPNPTTTSPLGSNKAHITVENPPQPTTVPAPAFTPVIAFEPVDEDTAEASAYEDDLPLPHPVKPFKDPATGDDPWR